jgi:hypothetical protein
MSSTHRAKSLDDTMVKKPSPSSAAYARKLDQLWRRLHTVSRQLPEQHPFNSCQALVYKKQRGQRSKTLIDSSSCLSASSILEADCARRPLDTDFSICGQRVRPRSAEPVEQYHRWQW